MSGARLIIHRQGRAFGPYSEAQLLYYLSRNQVVPNDIAYIEGEAGEHTVQEAMRLCGWSMPQAASPLAGMSRIGLGFILPWREIGGMRWTGERRFLYLSAIGLLPLTFPLLPEPSLVYVAIGLYVSLLWGLFFHVIFRTEQVQLGRCVQCYLGTAVLSVSALLCIHSLGLMNWAMALAGSALWPIQFVGMLLVAGLPEELAKMAVILWLSRRHRGVLSPRTLVLYGLFSGLGFGIVEGVLYQQGVNRMLDIDEAYFYNVLRLTALPFLHATWCGIASYFIAFAALFPSYRHGLWLLALLVPAMLHALYNSLGGLGIVPAFLSVLLFTIYLAGSQSLVERLK